MKCLLLWAELDFKGKKQAAFIWALETVVAGDARSSLKTETGIRYEQSTRVDWNSFCYRFVSTIIIFVCVLTFEKLIYLSSFFCSVFNHCIII